MVRTTERCQDSAALDQLQSPKMNLLISSQRIRNRSAIPGEGRRIENDSVKKWNQLLVRPDECLGLEPVENIDRFKGTFIRQTIPRRVRDGRAIDFLVPDAVGAYIEQEGLYR